MTEIGWPKKQRFDWFILIFVNQLNDLETRRKYKCYV